MERRGPQWYKKTMRVLVLLLLVSSSATLLSHCGRGGEGGEGTGGETVLPREKVRTGEVPIRHDFSFTGGVRMEVPRGFPGDVALYPGSALRMSQERSSRELVVILGTDAPPDRVESWYRGEMAGKGWRVARETALDDRRYLRFEKVGRVVALTIDPEEKETLVGLTCTLTRGGPR